MSAKRTYQLYLKVDGDWKWAGTIVGFTHQDALRQAIGVIKPEHYDKQLRLEQDATEEPPPSSAPGPVP